MHTHEINLLCLAEWVTTVTQISSSVITSSLDIAAFKTLSSRYHFYADVHGGKHQTIHSTTVPSSGQMSKRQPLHNGSCNGYDRTFTVSSFWYLVSNIETPAESCIPWKITVCLMFCSGLNYIWTCCSVSDEDFPTAAALMKGGGKGLLRIPMGIIILELSFLSL